jgi:protoheme IX farnesyltransferase
MKTAADISSVLDPELNEAPDSTEPARVAVESAAPSIWTDYYELTKPRMNFLVLITTMVGFVLASTGAIDWLLLFHTLLGTAMCASCSAILNQVIEKDLDALMPRTRNRPIAAGRIGTRPAIVFGLLLGVVGFVYLFAAVNLLTALLGLSTVLLYLFVYTPMKRTTSLNTVIGAIPGAIPPVMGFTAVHNALSIPAITVFAILFIWQMPHFLAIAILYRRDYSLAGFKMLPCIDEDLRLTGRMILLYSTALLPVSLLPSLIGMTGEVYFAAVLLLGLAFFFSGVSCVTTRTRGDARRLFFASIIYLPLLLGFLVFDRI